MEDSCASSFIEEELPGDTSREVRRWVRKGGKTCKGVMIEEYHQAAYSNDENLCL